LCNGVDDETEATLLAFRDTLREIESRGDTTHGIHIQFGPDTRYATIIKAIDICRTTVRAWELNDHDLWTLHIPEPKLRPENGPAQFSLDCGTSLTGCIIIPEPTISQTVETAFGLAWTGFIKPYWLSWLLFALIAALDIRRVA